MIDDYIRTLGLFLFFEIEDLLSGAFLLFLKQNLIRNFVAL